jgi:Plasmid pRiA4b ORF-3-like protein
VGMIGDMKAEHAELVDSLRRTRWVPLLRLIDAAEAGDGPPPTPDPAAVEPYRWLLARVGDGVPLTAAGYLPPAVVEETMRTLGWDAHRAGKNNREDRTYPVRELRELARRMGLLRVHRGVLLRTAAGRRLTDDPAELWWHLADRLLTARTEVERLAGMLFLLAVAAGRPRPHVLVAGGLTALGLVDEATGQPPDELAAVGLTRDTRAVFRQLGLLPRQPRDDAPPGPAAAQFARAALLGRGATGQATAPQAAARSHRAVELTVVLRGTKPPVWRRIVVPTSLTLRQLHAVLQTAMGWEDYHLHLFDVRGVEYGDVEDLPGELGDEDTYTVGDAAAAASEWRYRYDFGDGWDHDIRVGERLSAVGPGTPHCLDGDRACPPEDCGGPAGYQRLLDALADPADPEHDELLAWVGGEFDPDAFDLTGTNELLELYDRHTRQRPPG